MTCDPETGRIWLGDVGSDRFEEINQIEKGKNYGWGEREGFESGPYPEPEIPTGGFEDPYIAYGRQQGDTAIICGPVYRGAQLHDQLGGRLILGDNTSGRIWSLTLDSDPAKRTRTLLAQIEGSQHNGLSRIVSGASGEIYCLQLGRPGKIWRMGLSDSGAANLPARLSDTGIFTDLSQLSVAEGFTAYEINQPFWSDHAVKRRWLAVPNDGIPYDSDERVEMKHDENWEFPPGSVFVKHFDLPVTNQLQVTRRKLETRVLVVDQNAAVYGFTYKWRPDQSDADLVLTAQNESLPMPAGNGHQWSFPSPSDCRTCHNPTAGWTLGLNTRQLNLDLPDGSNQILEWESDLLGSFSQDRGKVEDWKRLTPIDDAAASLTDRVKTYLDVNCSFCHRPRGRGPTFDARLETPAVFQRLVNERSRSTRVGQRESIVAPGDPGRSEILARLDESATALMPPVGRNHVDRAGVNLLRAWIAALVPASDQPGFAAHYFADEDFQSAVEAKAVNQIDEAWGSDSPIMGIPADEFSVRWRGSFSAPVSGNHTISANAGGRVRMMINGAVVIDAGVAGAPATASFEQYFAAEEDAEIIVDFSHHTGDAFCSVACRMNGSGPNLFNSDNVTVSRSEFAIETRPALGLVRRADGTIGLDLFPEGRAVRIEQSADLIHWSETPSPGGEGQILVQDGLQQFFRIAPAP